MTGSRWTPGMERRQRGRARVRIALAAAVVFALGYMVIEAVRFGLHGPPPPLEAVTRVGRMVPPGGELVTLGTARGALLVPVSLYPGSQVQGGTLVPTGRDDEFALYLVLGTTDSPEVVRDYYERAWQSYGVSVRQQQPGKRYELATGRIAKRTASVEILLAAPGPPRSLDEPLGEAAPGRSETKIIFFVPWVGR